VTLVERGYRVIDGVKCMVAAEVTRPHRSPFVQKLSSTRRSAVAQAALDEQRQGSSSTTKAVISPARKVKPTSGKPPRPRRDGEVGNDRHDDGFLGPAAAGSRAALRALLQHSSQVAAAEGRATLASLVGDPGVYLCVTRLRPRAKGGSGTRRAGRDNGSDSPTPEFGSDTPHHDWPFTWADMPRRMVVLVPLAPSAFVTVRSQHPQAWSTAVEDGGLTWVETGLGTNTSGSLDRRSSSSATPRGRTTTLLVRRAFFRSLAKRLEL